MKYKFTTNPYGQNNIKDFYGVEYDSLNEAHKALFQIAWSGWTPAEIQMIIDKSYALSGDQKFKYQVVGSDLMIYVFSNEVFFCDLHSDNEEADFKCSFEEFITFMQDFKKFIEDNH